MVPWWAWVSSWFINLVTISILVAVVDMKEDYIIERMPAVGFFFIFIVPTAFEIISWWGVNQPFLSLIVPGFSLLY